MYTFRFVCFQDVLKTSSRHVSETSSRYVFKTSSRHVFKTSSRNVFKTSSRHIFKASSRHVFKTSSKHVFKTSSRLLQGNNFSSSKTFYEMSSRRFQDVLKISWKTKNCYAEDMLKTSSRRLEDEQMFGGLLPFVNQVDPYLNSIDMCSTNEITKTVYIFKKT